MFLARWALCFVLAEFLCVARAVLPLGWILPDPIVSLVVALALVARREMVLTSALLLALLRAPSTLEDPIMGSASLVAFAAFTLAIRHALSRERPPIALVMGFLGMLTITFLGDVAASARSAPAGGIWLAFPACLTTGALTMAWIPLLRLIPLTRPLLERRFGE